MKRGCALKIYHTEDSFMDKSDMYFIHNRSCSSCKLLYNANTSKSKK